MDLDDRFTFISYTAKRTIIGYLKWSWFIFIHLFRVNPEIIHTMSFLNWFGLLPYLFFRKKKRVFYDCRDYFAWSKMRTKAIVLLIMTIDRIGAYFCKKVVFPDEAGYAYFRASNKTKFKVIPNTVKDEFFKIKSIRKGEIDRGRIRLAFLGYTSKDRNIETIIEAIKRFKNLELHVASSYISRKLTHFTKSERVFFHGKLKREEMLKLLMVSDYCLMTYDPSLKNHVRILPTKFFDCLMTNTPFICSKGMISLEQYVGQEWPNHAIDYGEVEAFKNLAKPIQSYKNRSLYEEKYAYSIIMNQVKVLYDEFLNLDSSNHEVY